MGLFDYFVFLCVVLCGFVAAVAVVFPCSLSGSCDVETLHVRAAQSSRVKGIFSIFIGLTVYGGHSCKKGFYIIYCYSLL